ncbi:hypothetical protein LO771_23330 [Streptacidiphilus sp. ASG 303]|uniref:hypothetical protein n=1 Tax=Streptacidiphilus sp. ASG 303 TaxID=2896847 RepID=UPI001E51BF5C|nr:hypothetical protein [Streptacidiphilus sp. ASG 303]MCD0485236.1 hypothetical protein [Streptacidiphilus sp. ASG 303]
MPSLEHDALPDVAIGHHPDHGIVAANPKQLTASTWMLKGLDFHPVPGHPTLYALADQQRDGQDRARRAVMLLRGAGYRVDADAAFDPVLDPEPAAGRDRTRRGEPDVAFAEHPQLGIVAATADHSFALGGRQILEEHGWRHNPHLDIYTLPITTGRDQALTKVAAATRSMHRFDLQVAVQPRLAQGVAKDRLPGPRIATAREHSPGLTTRTFPIATAALAAGPARSGLPGGKAPHPAPTASAQAAHPVDPRFAFSRNR